MKVATWLGLAVSTAATLWSVVVVYQYFFWTNPDGTPCRQPGFTFLYIAMLLSGSVQISLIGLIGEYLARTCEQVQARPLYIVDELIVDELIDLQDTPARGGADSGLLIR